MSSIIGAHVSAAGGAMNALPRAKELGINAIQIFASAPGNWYPPKTTPDEAKAFGEAAKAAGIEKIFFHSIYLINLATDNPELAEKSVKSLISALDLNAQMNGDGVIFHVGSSKERTFDDVKNTVIERINEIIAKSDPKSTLVIETNAGQGNCIGDTFEEVAELIAGVNNKDRVRVCLDTAHTFASGYDLVSDAEGVIKKFDQVIGLKYLIAIHTNDSKVELNSRVDRHENIGQGKIGEAPFGKLLNMPELADVPFILEVPGMDGKSGPDKANMEILKRLSK